MAAALGDVPTALARFAVAADPPPLALQRAEAALADVTGCMFAGMADDATLGVARMAGALGAGPVAVPGSRMHLPAPMAALVGGTAAHALDFDDNFAPGLTHASAIAAPAIFALAQMFDLPGPAVIRAHVLALELQARIAGLFGIETYARGWHATSSLGAIGTAGACAVLIGLPPAAVRAAMTIATSMSGGSKAQFGSPMKAVHAGIAAQAAVLATLMAQAGLDGTEDPLGGPMGLVSLMSRPPEQAQAEAAVAGLGQDWALVTEGLMPKLHPCCGAAHRTLDGIAALRAAHGFAPGQIAAIEARVNPMTVQNLRFDRPATVAEARFSLTYPAARVAAFGRLSLADMTPDALADPAMQALGQRVRMIAEPAAPDPGAPVHLAIRLTDGQTLTTTVTESRGTLHAPFAPGEMRQKLRDCCHWAGADPDLAEAALAGLGHKPFRETARLLCQAANPEVPSWA